MRRKILKLCLLDDSDHSLCYTLLENTKRKTIVDKGWYSNTLPEYDDVQFRSTFRMNKECLIYIFELFCNESGSIRSEKTRKIFDMMIYYTMYNISNRALAEKFGERLTTT